MAVKVSQATIDKIKAMGMTKALKGASGASPEMKEALTRMYGARRVSAAGGMKSKPVAKSPDQARGAMKATSKPVYKSADAARAGMPGKGPTVKVAQAAAKKANTTSNPFTAAHNKLSPYGNKSQKYVSGLPKEGLAGRSQPGKPSISEQFTSAVGGVLKGKGVPNRMTAAQVAKINADRLKAIAAAKAAKK